jgi:energy-coupling factor transporter transmembrane protein EcfT
MNMKIGGIALCRPAYVYLILSLITFILFIALQSTGSAIMGFVLQVMIWVFILNLICSSGYENVSWFLVLFPFIIMVLMLIFYTTLFTMAKTQAQIETSKNTKKSI